MATALTADQLRSLPVSFGIEVAGRAFGLGRTKTHEMARAGTFPVRVLRIGSQYRVTRADLFRALGESDSDLEEAGSDVEVA